MACSAIHVPPVRVPNMRPLSALHVQTATLRHTKKRPTARRVNRVALLLTIALSARTVSLEQAPSLERARARSATRVMCLLQTAPPTARRVSRVVLLLTIEHSVMNVPPERVLSLEQQIAHHAMTGTLLLTREPLSVRYAVPALMPTPLA